METLPDRPVGYATMGTVVSRVAGVFGLILTALREEPVSLVDIVGRNQDPDAYGLQPANVHIERSVPQSLLFSRCDLVMTHGDSGTLRTALAHELPMVIVPIAANQPDNAHRCECLEAASVVGRDDRTPAAIRVAVQGVMDDPAHRRNVQRLRADMERLPGPQEVVGWLQDLVQAQRPVTAVP